MNKVKILQVFKDGGSWYFGGYGYDGGISPERSPLKSMTFPSGLVWHEETELNKATEYLTKNGFTYRVLILEYQTYLL